MTGSRPDKATSWSALTQLEPPLRALTDNSSIGTAWVFTRRDGIWTQQGNKLVGTGAVAPSVQGASVALSDDGNVVIVGGWNDNPVGGVDSLSVGAAWEGAQDWTGISLQSTGAAFNGRKRMRSKDRGAIWIG
jgi:hypothetical protein